MTEPEFVAEDGTVRKAHYGVGRQPWDDIVDQGWGEAFAAGNVLKYVRRHAAKNGADDLAKARWYYAELVKLALPGYHSVATGCLVQLMLILTDEEKALVRCKGAES